jgi:hypothetical protein
MENDGQYEHRLEQKLDVKFDHLSNKIEMMATSLSEFAQSIAKKEVSDHYMKEQLAEARQEIKEHAKSTKAELSALKTDVSNLKLVSAGDNTMRKVFWGVLIFVVLGVAGAVLKTVITQ